MSYRYPGPRPYSGERPPGQFVIRDGRGFFVKPALLPSPSPGQRVPRPRFNRPQVPSPAEVQNRFRWVKPGGTALSSNEDAKGQSTEGLEDGDNGEPSQKTEEIQTTEAYEEMPSDSYDSETAANMTNPDTDNKGEDDEDDEEEDTSFCQYCNQAFTNADAYYKHTRGMLHTQKLMEAESQKKQTQGTGDEGPFTTIETRSAVEETRGIQAKPYPPLINRKPLKPGEEEYDFSSSNWMEMAEEKKSIPLEERDFTPDDIGKKLSDEFMCEICNVKCSGALNFKMHIEGIKHKQREERMKEWNISPKPASTEPEVKIWEIQVEPRIQKALEKANTPLIGLQYVTEFQKEDGKGLPRYVCNLCEAKCDGNTIIPHVGGSKHRLKYLKNHYPDTYNHLTSYNSVKKKSELNRNAEEFAEDINKKEGGLQKVKVKIEIPRSTEIAAESLLKKSGINVPSVSEYIQDVADRKKEALYNEKEEDSCQRGLKSLRGPGIGIFQHEENTEELENVRRPFLAKKTGFPSSGPGLGRLQEEENTEELENIRRPFAAKRPGFPLSDKTAISKKFRGDMTDYQSQTRNKEDLGSRLSRFAGYPDREPMYDDQERDSYQGSEVGSYDQQYDESEQWNYSDQGNYDKSQGASWENREVFDYSAKKQVFDYSNENQEKQVFEYGNGNYDNDSYESRKQVFDYGNGKQVFDYNNGKVEPILKKSINQNLVRSESQSQVSMQQLNRPHQSHSPMQHLNQPVQSHVPSQQSRQPVQSQVPIQQSAQPVQSKAPSQQPRQPVQSPIQQSAQPVQNQAPSQAQVEGDENEKLFREFMEWKKKNKDIDQGSSVQQNQTTGVQQQANASQDKVPAPVPPQEEEKEDKSSITDMLNSLSQTLIRNEEEAAMALQVSNALTQALLQYRLMNVPQQLKGSPSEKAQNDAILEQHNMMKQLTQQIQQEQKAKGHTTESGSRSQKPNKSDRTQSASSKERKLSAAEIREKHGYSLPPIELPPLSAAASSEPSSVQTSVAGVHTHPSNQQENQYGSMAPTPQGQMVVPSQGQMSTAPHGQMAMPPASQMAPTPHGQMAMAPQSHMAAPGHHQMAMRPPGHMPAPGHHQMAMRPPGHMPAPGHHQMAMPSQPDASPNYRMPGVQAQQPVSAPSKPLPLGAQPFNAYSTQLQVKGQVKGTELHAWSASLVKQAQSLAPPHMRPPLYRGAHPSVPHSAPPPLPMGVAPPLPPEPAKPPPPPPPH